MIYNDFYGRSINVEAGVKHEGSILSRLAFNIVIDCVMRISTNTPAEYLERYPRILKIIFHRYLFSHTKKFELV